MGIQGHCLTAQAQRQEKRDTMGNFSSNPFTTKYRQNTQETSLLSKTLLFHQTASLLLHSFSITRVLSAYNSQMQLKASEILHVPAIKGFIACTTEKAQGKMRNIVWFNVRAFLKFFFKSVWLPPETWTPKFMLGSNEPAAAPLCLQFIRNVGIVWGSDNLHQTWSDQSFYIRCLRSVTLWCNGERVGHLVRSVSGDLWGRADVLKIMRQSCKSPFGREG